MIEHLISRFSDDVEENAIDHKSQKRDLEQVISLS